MAFAASLRTNSVSAEVFAEVGGETVVASGEHFGGETGAILGKRNRSQRLTRQIKRIDGVELRHCERRIRKTEVIRGKTSEMLCLSAVHRGIAELGGHCNATLSQSCWASEAVKYRR